MRVAALEFTQTGGQLGANVGFKLNSFCAGDLFKIKAHKFVFVVFPQAAEVK